MGIELNAKQKWIKNDIINWWKQDNEQVYEYGGYAGTGKTTMLYDVIDRLRLKPDDIAPMSFIGQMAIVMRTKGLYNARTIHSWLYKPVEKIKTDKAGNIIMNTYFNTPQMELGFEPKMLDNKKLMIIDEAGSTPYWMKEEIESRGIKIIATGDIGQLPPVGDKPAYLYGKDIPVLDEIMRQNAHSGILYLATRARMGLPIHKGFYGDVYVIEQDELTNEMLYYSNVVLCGKNKTRDNINNKIRRELLGIKSDLPVMHEKLVCRKNNWNLEVDGINLANGLAGTVTNMPGINTFDGDTFELDFKPNLLNSSFHNIRVDYNYLTSDHEERQKLKSNRFAKGEKFEFGYALTTHMSQGSEYPNGLFIEEVLNPNFHNNFLYTGITRFSNSLILVKRSKKYY